MKADAGINRRNREIAAGLMCCAVLLALTLVLVLAAMKLGSINVTYRELFRGLFVEYDRRVAVIYDLRFPRILVALLGGAALSCSGLLFQAVLKNPLADPGIIGISGGASLTASVITAFFPMLYFSVPLFACAGGLAAFCLIYSLSWKGSLDPVRIILVGIAVAAVFSGVQTVFNGMMDSTGVTVSVSGLAQLEWTDVRMLAFYAVAGLALALLLSPLCNLLTLEDQTVRSLGHNVDRIRLVVSAVACLLVSGVTAVVGIVGFLALIVPHMARRFAGSDHRVLVPCCILLGSFVLLLADTLGRCVAQPNEIPASVIMAICGGPFFIFLLKRGDRFDKH